jgi:3-hydroxyisobutyrate dehydrogenase-like beta-hydroxyacid dehydrogenase
VTVESIGLLHPGEMGAGVGAALVRAGYTVRWASAGRSEATRRRAESAGLLDVGTAQALAETSDLILSVCPPDAALDVAAQLPPRALLYLDANAIAPSTAREVARIVESRGANYVDGGIIGPPPGPGRPTRLYLSGPAAGAVADLFAGTVVEAITLSPEPTAASALKMCYAAWSKGSAALLLATRALAVAIGVEEPLLEAWQRAQPELASLSVRAAQQATTKGWRWTGEMSEIAATFGSAGLPAGFHEAAADLYARPDRDERAAADETTLATVVAALLGRPAPGR